MITNFSKEQFLEQLGKYPQSNFGAVRKHDIHTGIDIYLPENKPIYPLQSGKIVQIGIFTGNSVNSPWWNETEYVVIKTDNFFILYGEILLDKNLKIGYDVNVNSELGVIKSVLKKDKGVNPVSMLHIEQYTELPFVVDWKLNELKPNNLMNPFGFIWENL